MGNDIQIKIVHGQINEKTLIIVVERISAPFFFLWKWSRKDYEKAVIQQLEEGVEAHFLFLVEDFIYDKDRPLPNRSWAMYARVIFILRNPSTEILDGISNPSGSNGLDTAKKIYEWLSKTIENIILYGRLAAKQPTIIDGHRESFNELFYTRDAYSTRNLVFWRMGKEGKLKRFTLAPQKKTRQINPLLKSTNILSVEKWKKIASYSLTNPKISKEIAELLRIKHKTDWGERRIPTIETAALMEVVIRNYVQIVLLERGQSQRKIKNVTEEVGLSVLLNLFLPTSINKNDFSRHKNYLDALDNLRKVRNDIMHANLPDKDIDLETVRKGVSAAIKITSLLESYTAKPKLKSVK